MQDTTEKKDVPEAQTLAQAPRALRNVTHLGLQFRVLERLGRSSWGCRRAPLCCELSEWLSHTESRNPADGPAAPQPATSPQRNSRSLCSCHVIVTINMGIPI